MGTVTGGEGRDLSSNAHFLVCFISLPNIGKLFSSLPSEHWATRIQENECKCVPKGHFQTIYYGVCIQERDK